MVPIMQRAGYPITPAIRVLRENKIQFDPHLYSYREHGGTAHSAAQLGVDEHIVIKTLVMETESRTPLIALMHGDREVSTKELARTLSVKSVLPCDPSTAQRHTGYQVGGTSPFGTRKGLPVFAEQTIFELSKIYINGGKRGFLVSMDPDDLKRVLPITEVAVGIAKE